MSIPELAFWATVAYLWIGSIGACLSCKFADLVLKRRNLP